VTQTGSHLASSVTVLGSSSSIPRPGRACSCYLVRGPGHAIALDMGTGAFSNLRRHLLADELDAVVISHMHPDHFLDLIPLRYALRYGPRANDRRIALYLPPGGEPMLRKMVAAFAAEPSGDYLSLVYDVRTYDPAGLRIGDAELRFAPTKHYIPTFAIRYDYDGRSVTYSADTAPEPRVSELARSSGVFLCEATLLGAETGAGAFERGHLTPREAGALARDARVGRLVLTHYGAQTTESELLAEAGEAFDGEIVVADDQLQLALD
jgi:ribonuclease BN (tRNA processing enzyme)